MTGYRRRVESFCKALSDSAHDRYKIDLDFNQEHTIGRAPSYAPSEFMTNRAMGDWAESLLHGSLSRALYDYKIVKYGNSDQIVAGTTGFPEFYFRYQTELKETRKRPDLLVFSVDNYDSKWSDDISSYDRAELLKVAKKAACGIEVRSSKYLAEEYLKMRREEGNKSARQAPSFTTKLEDLRIVARWIASHGVPHFYAQVFFDSVYMIPFERILQLLGDGPRDVKLESNDRNQRKPTFHIPITYGTKIGVFTTAPEFKAEVLKKNARIQPFLRPAGGHLELDRATVRSVLGLTQ